MIIANNGTVMTTTSIERKGKPNNANEISNSSNSFLIKNSRWWRPRKGIMVYRSTKITHESKDVEKEGRKKKGS